MRLTPCECPAAGWCERHGCYKPDHLFQMCRRRRDVFEQWEQGNGPCLQFDEQGQTGADSANGPGVLRRAANFTRASFRHLADGCESVTDEQYERRMQTCRECPSCEPTLMVCREQECGCFVSVKARWASEECPLQRWPAIEAEESTSKNVTMRQPTTGLAATNIDQVR